MSISAINSLSLINPASSSTGQNVPSGLFSDHLKAAATGNFTDALPAPDNSDPATKEFMDYMKKSPAERMQEAWLAQHHITKEQFDAMSPADKQKLLEQMKQEIEAKIRRQVEESAAKSSKSGILA